MPSDIKAIPATRATTKAAGLESGVPSRMLTEKAGATASAKPAAVSMMAVRKSRGLILDSGRMIMHRSKTEPGANITRHRRQPYKE